MSSVDFIYFGGAFDPVHLGHIDAVKIVREAFPDAKITIIPGFLVPVAGGGVKAPATPFVDRVAMAVVAFDEWPLVDVSSMEEELPTPNYTVQTIEALVGDLPAARIGWMIGADQLANFTEWKNAKRILELTSLIVLPRPAAKIDNTLQLAQTVATSLGFSVTVDSEHQRIDLDGGCSIHVMTKAPASTSSSEVRALAAQSLSKVQNLVPHSVIEYIADLGLYQQVVEKSYLTT
jgi:nicotinate-nucleotide adenylyltransferase